MTKVVDERDPLNIIYGWISPRHLIIMCLMEDSLKNWKPVVWQEILADVFKSPRIGAKCCKVCVCVCVYIYI